VPLVVVVLSRGIAIEELESELEGDIDLNGFLGLDATAPKGYTEIRAKFRVKADPADVESIKALAEFSPVFNTITNSANVEVTVPGPFGGPVLPISKRLF
jgi:uncharacterized OsmC-like protein